MGEQVAQATAMPICVGLFFADHAILGDDKTLTVVRTVDTVNLREAPPIEHGDTLVLDPLKLVAMLKTGNARGKFNLAFLSVNPGGTRSPIGIAPEAAFEGPPESGANVVAEVGLEWHGPGLYWIELEVNGVQLARTPLKLNVPPAQSAPAAKKAVRKPKRG
jgi:hypothetical protein